MVYPEVRFWVAARLVILHRPALDVRTLYHLYDKDIPHCLAGSDGRGENEKTVLYLLTIAISAPR